MPSRLPIVPSFETAVIGSLTTAYGSGDMSDELSRTKALLLYSDHVSIESHRASFLMARFTMQVRTARTRLGPLLENQPPFTDDEIRESLKDHSFWNEHTKNEFTRALKMSPAAVFDFLEDVRERMRREIESDNGFELDNSAMFRDFSEVAVTRWVQFKPDVRPRTAITALSELNRLYDLGLVTIDPGDLSRFWLAEEDALDKVATDMLRRVVESVQIRDAHPLLTGSTATDDGVTISLSNRAKLAGAILGSLPNLDYLPMDELLDVRESLAPHVARFRAAIADLESGLDDAPSDFAKVVSEIKLRNIDPEIEALNESLRADGLLPTLARGVPLTAGGTIGLAISAVVGGPVLAGAALVSAGLASAVAQEYLRRRTANDERTKNRFFFLWKAQQKLGH